MFLFGFFILLRNYFRDMYALIWKSNGVTVEISRWQTLIDTTVPQQITRNDCAIFSAMFALFKAYEIPFSLFNHNANYWRKKLACDLLYGKFQGTHLESRTEKVISLYRSLLLCRTFSHLIHVLRAAISTKCQMHQAFLFCRI